LKGERRTSDIGRPKSNEKNKSQVRNVLRIADLLPFALTKSGDLFKLFLSCAFRF